MREIKWPLLATALGLSCIVFLLAFFLNKINISPTWNGVATGLTAIGSVIGYYLSLKSKREKRTDVRLDDVEDAIKKCVTIDYVDCKFDMVEHAVEEWRQIYDSVFKRQEDFMTETTKQLKDIKILIESKKDEFRQNLQHNIKTE